MRPMAGMRDFVRLLNDPGRGALLDALCETRRRLASGEPFGEDKLRETLYLLSASLLDRLALAGVRPIRDVGETLRLTPAQIARRFEYHGSPFSHGERRKRVMVTSPGWAVRGRTAVRPVVREAPEP